MAALARLKWWCSILSTFVLPAAVTIWVGLASLTWTDIPRTVFICVLVVLFLAWILCGCVSMRSVFLASELYLEHAEVVEEHRATLSELNADLSSAKEEIRDLKSGINSLSVVKDISFFWSIMLNQYIIRGVNGLGDLAGSVEEVLSTVTENGNMIFGFGSNELWNFAVYRYDPDVKRLRPIVRRKHHSHPSQGMGRDWDPGLGHVGLAFARRKALITGDATDPAVAGLLAPPGDLAHDYDDRVYVSFAAIPILSNSETANPLGVLVGTSDQRGRFSEANSLILAQAAPVLACMMSLAHISTRGSSSGNGGG